MAGGDTKQRINDLESQIMRLKEAQPTLRDQFAMVALNGVLTAIPFGTEFNIKEITLSCYKIAEAMMEIRNAQG